MGGRGSKGFGPSGGGSLKYQKNALGPEVPATLKEALGSKGSPHTIANSYEHANPHFSRAYAEYSANCQRCVVAYEARRRGYNVMALPTYSGDEKPRVAFTAADGTVNGRWMGAFQNAKAQYVGARTTAKATSNLNEAVKSFGSGARGVVQVFWQKGGGHVFNVENVGGKAQYFDAQTGKKVNIKEYMSNAQPTSVNIIRTDNLRFSNRAREFVTQSR